MKKTILTTLLISCFIVCFATVTDFSGKWTGRVETEGGEVYPLAYNFKVEGDHLTGTAQTPKGEVTIEDGKINESNFSFSVEVAGMEIEHTGKFYGDSIGVDIAVSDIKAHTTLTRGN